MSWAELWHQELFRQAVLAGTLAAVLCGVLGTFVVLRRLTFLAGGVSHAAFGGLGAFHFLGWSPQIGALVTAGLAAFLLGPLDRRRQRSQDALIGVLWAAGMAVGVLFLHLTPGYPPDLSAYLFGNILLVSFGDLAALAVFLVITLVLLGLFFKEIVAFTFDETFAAVQGVPVRALATLLLLMTAFAVVVLLPVVGLLLVLALLTIPPLVGLQLSRSLPGALGIAVATGLVITLGGLLLAFRFDLPSGPAIILLGVVFLALVSSGRRWLNRGAARP